MSPQELINNLGALRRRGAFDNPDLKTLIEAKLAEAKTATRVSAFKAEEAMKAADLSDDVRRSLEKVADAQVKAKGRIDRPTALLIDKSGSMSMAIELGKRIGALVSSVSAQALYVYAFDTIAYPIECSGRRPGRLGEGTQGHHGRGRNVVRRRPRNDEAQAAIRRADHRRHRRRGEHRSPLRRDLEEVPRGGEGRPNVCFVRTPGGQTLLEDQCRAAGIRRMDSSSRAITTPCRTWCRCCPGHRSWTSDGNPGVPAAGPQAGVSGTPSINRARARTPERTNQPAFKLVPQKDLVNSAPGTCVGPGCLYR